MRKTEKYLKLILALESNPLMSLKELAEKVDVSWPTVKKRYETAKDEQIIQHPIAHIDYRKLGLQRISIIAFVPDYQNLLLLEKMCGIHPYTVYRSRIIGQRFGLFMHFFIPQNDPAPQMLMELFEELKARKIISDMDMFSEEQLYLNIFPDLDRWEDNKWEFSWQDWFDSIQEHNDPVPTPAIPLVDFEELTKVRLLMLRHLTRDASIKQTDFMDILDLSRTEAHRHHTFVMDNLITDVELLYDRVHFDLTDLFIYIIPGMEDLQLRRMYHGMKQDPPPFRFSFQIMEDNTVLMWGVMSTLLANEFGFELWKRHAQMKMYATSLLKESSSRYWFYHENFDVKSKSWKVDRRYILTDPLSKLDDSMQSQVE